MDWKEAIRQWRALPEEEKHRRRWESIPRRVAASFAFSGEPVDLAMLEAEHAKRAMPNISTTRQSASLSPSRECCPADVSSQPIERSP